MPENISSLYDFGETKVNRIKKDAGEDLIFNLASDEYFSVVKNYLDSTKVVDFKFTRKRMAQEKSLESLLKE